MIAIVAFAVIVGLIVAGTSIAVAVSEVPPRSRE